MKTLILFLLVVSLAGCAVSNNPLRKEVKLLQKGVIKDDTSYVYALPYEEGKRHRVVQGYFGFNLLAIKFPNNFRLKVVGK